MAETPVHMYGRDARVKEGRAGALDKIANSYGSFPTLSLMSQP